MDNMGMKTTLEFPETFLRRLKSAAALRGTSMRQLIQDSVEAQLRGGPTETGWRAVFNKARGLDTKPVKQAIAEEFSRVDPRDWAE